MLNIQHSNLCHANEQSSLCYFFSIDVLYKTLRFSLARPLLANVKGLGGAGGGAGALRGPIDSNRSFAVTSNLRIFLAAWETFRHIQDFRSSVSCFRFG